MSDLVAVGYRREEMVEHRGELAVRGSIVDVFPSTADRPVRIDLWGDEVDRLTEFSVSDQRSTDDLGDTLLFPCRELLPTSEVRARAEQLVGLEPWGREQWERLAQGLVFDGRVTEDFKLDSGTWVSVGVLRPDLVAACSPYLQDAVVAGQDKPFIAVLFWPSIAGLTALAADEGPGTPFDKLTAIVTERLTASNAMAGGSSLENW